MEDNIATKARAWKKLIRGGKLEDVETLLNTDSLLIDFLDKKATRIAGNIIREKGVFYSDDLAELSQKRKELVDFGVPKDIVDLMAKNPDFYDLSANSMAGYYQYLVGRGIPEVAAATIASTEYDGRNNIANLRIINSKYRTLNHNCETNKIPLSFLACFGRYDRLFKVPTDKNEIREMCLAFCAMDVVYNGNSSEAA